MTKDLELTKKVLSVIAEEQMTSASVELKIGTTTKGNHVVHGGVYIRDCPASVIKALQKKGFVLSLDAGYLTILYLKKEV